MNEDAKKLNYLPIKVIPESPATQNYQGQTIHLATLIELGKNGLFPLFYTQWLKTSPTKEETSFTKDDRDTLRKIIDQLSNHKSIERKRTILLSLSVKDRDLFVSTFLKLVEEKILDDSPDLH